jgi:hypothetical protein
MASICRTIRTYAKRPVSEICEGSQPHAPGQQLGFDTLFLPNCANIPLISQPPSQNWVNLENV